MTRRAKATSAFIPGRKAALAFALVAMALLALAPAAQAAKYVDRVVAGAATAGTTQGLFNTPRDIAVNHAGGFSAGGVDNDVYVVDSTNHRIQRFDEDGNFVLMWGRGVDTGAAAAEICTAADVPCQAGTIGVAEGMFDNPQGVDINQATGDVYVRDRGNRRIQQFDAEGSFIRAWGWGVDTGAAAFEICVAGCQTGLTGGNGGQLATSTSTSTGIAVAPAAAPNAGNVLVTDPGNRRVQEFGPNGGFVRLWGYDVVATGQAGDIGAEHFEICSSTATGVCKIAAAAGGNQIPGRFTLNNPVHIAVDDEGTVYANGGSAASPDLHRFDSTAAQPADLLAPGVFVPAGTGGVSGMAIDPSTGNLFLARTAATGVQELADPGTTPTFLPASMPNIGAGTLAGLAVDPDSDTLYISFPHRVFAADEDGAPPAVSTVEGATAIEADSATLTGCADPLGPSVSPFTASYRFQYSADGKNWTDAAPAANLGADPIDCDDPANRLSASITGLLANTTYRVRIVTNRQFNNPDVLSLNEVVFTTDALPPAVVTMPPSGRTDTSAVLAGTVNPHGASTTYRFQWGKTPAYGNEVPVPHALAGEGGTAEPRAYLLTGLLPSTTYHYRLCAQSVKGSACGENQTFTTRPAFAGFAARAYEQVSRSKMTVKLTKEVFSERELIHSVASDGSAITFEGYGFTPDEPYGDQSEVSPGSVISSRTGENWESVGVSRRTADTAHVYPLLTFFDSKSHRGAISSNIGFLGDPDPKGGTYLRDYASDSDAFLYPGTRTAAAPEAATADLSHLVLSSTAHLIPDLGPPAVAKVYEWANGEPRLVSVDEGGVPFTTASQVGGPLAVQYDLDAISADGRHIFFSTPSFITNTPFTATPPAATKIYRRTDGATTALASPSKRTPADPLGERGKVYHAASADGDRVFFSSAELLTDDANTGPARAGRDLYRYELSTDTLVNLSAESNTDNGARVRGFLGASKSGDRVYYVAFGQPIAGAGEEGQPNVYAWHDDGSPGGKTKYIATLGQGAPDQEAYLDNNPHTVIIIRSGRRSHVSANGRTLVFQSAEPLTGQPTNGHTQIYVHEATTGTLSCASCRPDGAPSLGGSRVGAFNLSEGAGISTWYSTGARAIDANPPTHVSADGRRVFFHTTDALLPGDTNEAHDVYLWEEGRLNLISSGTDEHGAYFAGVSHSGDDAFFWTSVPLVGQDYGDNYDIYTARVGGGLPAQHPLPPDEPCQGDGCKPAATPLPAPTPAPPSATFSSEGNYVVPFSVARLSANQLRSLATQGRTSVRVRVEQPGRLIVKALRGKRVVGTASRVLMRPTTANVPLRLNQAARRALNRQGRLNLRIEVRFAGEEQTAEVSLRRANRNQRGSK